MRFLSALIFAGLASAVPTWRRQINVPSYVMDYAPLLHLYTEELYLPSDIGAQITHTIPEVNYVTVSNQTYTLANLDQLNALGGNKVYLTSKEGIQALPNWFQGIQPDPAGTVHNAKTCAIVVVEKPDIDGGVVDVFYFYFYAYNEGNEVNLFGIDIGEYGDHVGDWEHNMIRFKNGIPQAIWYSQHAFGEAFTYNAVEKQGTRPVVYVGKGTHANWATPGFHDHTLQIITLPGVGILTDYTDSGPLYDPTRSSYFYKYDLPTQKFTSYDGSPVNWLNFQGYWGDQQLPNNAPGQKILFGNAKYSSGPNGPQFKDLDRTNVCPQSRDICIELLNYNVVVANAWANDFWLSGAIVMYESTTVSFENAYELWHVEEGLEYRYVDDFNPKVEG